MSRSTDAGHFFQTSDALATTDRKAAKSKNKHGNPLKLTSKILAVLPESGGAASSGVGKCVVYVAAAAGEVRRVDLGDVCCPFFSSSLFLFESGFTMGFTGLEDGDLGLF